MDSNVSGYQLITQGKSLTLSIIIIFLICKYLGI